MQDTQDFEASALVRQIEASAPNGDAPETSDPTDKLAQTVRLDGMELEAFFAADVRPTAVRFKIAGNDAVIWLTPMGSDARDAYAAKIASLTRDGKLSQEPSVYRELSEASAQLVQHTVSDFTLWTRAPDTEDEWQQVRPPEDPKQVGAFIRNAFKAVPKAWDALVQECLSVNGFGGESPKK